MEELPLIGRGSERDCVWKYTCSEEEKARKSVSSWQCSDGLGSGQGHDLR